MSDQGASRQAGSDDGPPDRPAGPEPSTSGRSRPSSDDPLRPSRTSGIWAAVVGLVVVLVLLAIFVLQNTQEVEVSFLGWTGRSPLAASLLIATAAGLLIAVMAGSLRLLQVRRRVRRDRKRG